jgi:putative ABC transport system permease protein
MLKAIGTPNSTVAVAAIIQIIAVTLVGIAIGGLAAWGLALGLPPNIPIVFDLRTGVTALASLLLTGPIGGLVSIRYSLRVEPLTALGLGS